MKMFIWFVFLFSTLLGVFKCFWLLLLFSLFISDGNPFVLSFWAILCNYMALEKWLLKYVFSSFAIIIIEAFFVCKTASQLNVNLCMTKQTSLHINTMQLFYTHFHSVIFLVLWNILWPVLICCLCAADFKLIGCYYLHLK